MVVPEKSVDDGLLAPASVLVVRPSLCFIAVGLIMIGNGIFNAGLYMKFTPVYSATECGDEKADVDDFSVGPSNIHVGLKIEVTCLNPNPYSIKILASDPGRVFVGGNRNLQVGQLTVLPGSSLPAHRAGSVHVSMSSDITGVNADELVPHFMNDPAVPVFMELQFDVGVSLAFGVRQWGTQVPYRKKCGMNVGGLLVNNYGARSRLGPLVCRDTWHQLHLPPVGFVDETPEDGQMGFTAAQVAPEEVAEGELAKNLSLGIVITLSFLGGSLFIYCAFFGHIWAARRQRFLAMLAKRARARREEFAAMCGRWAQFFSNQRQNLSAKFRSWRERATMQRRPPETPAEGQFSRLPQVAPDDAQEPLSLDQLEKSAEEARKKMQRDDKEKDDDEQASASTSKMLASTDTSRLKGGEPRLGRSGVESRSSSRVGSRSASPEGGRNRDNLLGTADRPLSVTEVSDLEGASSEPVVPSYKPEKKSTEIRAWLGTKTCAVSAHAREGTEQSESAQDRKGDKAADQV